MGASIENTVSVNPFSIAKAIDLQPHCWWILAFDSESPNSDLVQLLEFASKGLYERCGVGSLDLSYPSNAEYFKSVEGLTQSDLPALIGKYAGSMIEKRDNVRRSYPMQANATGWGQVIEKEYLADDLAMTFDFFNHEFWDRMDESQKIRMIYSPLYSAESKVLMQTKIKAYDDGITEACDE